MLVDQAIYEAALLLYSWVNYVMHSLQDDNQKPDYKIFVTYHPTQRDHPSPALKAINFGVAECYCTWYEHNQFFYQTVLLNPAPSHLNF